MKQQFKKSKRIIIVNKQKSPKIYRIILKKGGQVEFNNIIMTIKKPKVSLLQLLKSKLILLFT
jgi:hypothetical protein